MNREGFLKSTCWILVLAQLETGIPLAHGQPPAPPAEDPPPVLKMPKDNQCPFKEWAAQNEGLSDLQNYTKNALNNLKNCGASSGGNSGFDSQSMSQNSSTAMTGMSGNRQQQTCDEGAQGIREEYAEALGSIQSGTALDMTSSYQACAKSGPPVGAEGGSQPGPMNAPTQTPSPAPQETQSKAGDTECLDKILKKKIEQNRKTCKKQTIEEMKSAATSIKNELDSLTSEIVKSKCDDSVKMAGTTAAMNVAGKFISSYGGIYGNLIGGVMGNINSLVNSLKTIKIDAMEKSINGNQNFPQIACLYYQIQDLSPDTGKCSNPNKENRSRLAAQKELEFDKDSEKALGCAKDALSPSSQVKSILDNFKGLKQSISNLAEDSPKREFYIMSETLKDLDHTVDFQSMTNRTKNFLGSHPELSRNERAGLMALNENLSDLNQSLKIVRSKKPDEPIDIDTLKAMKKAIQKLDSDPNYPLSGQKTEVPSWYSSYVNRVLLGSDQPAQAKDKTAVKKNPSGKAPEKASHELDQQEAASLMSLALADQKYEEAKVVTLSTEAKLNLIQFSPMKADNNATALKHLMNGFQRVHRTTFKNKLDQEVSTLKSLIQKDQKSSAYCEQKKNDDSCGSYFKWKNNILGSVNNVVNICTSTASMFLYDSESDQISGAFKGRGKKKKKDSDSWGNCGEILSCFNLPTTPPENPGDFSTIQCKMNENRGAIEGLISQALIGSGLQFGTAVGRPGNPAEMKPAKTLGELNSGPAGLLKAECKNLEILPKSIYSEFAK